MKKLILLSLLPLLASNLWAQSPCDTLPRVSVTASNSTPCLGESISITATGGKTYFWNKGIKNGQSFSPSVSDTFQVIVTDTLGCKDTSTVAIEVLPLPNVTANSNSLNICLGDSVLLNASNANSYSWITPSIPNNSYFTPTKTGTNIYSVEGTGANGCVNTSQVIVIVNANPLPPTLSTNGITTCLDIPFAEDILATASKGRVIWFSDNALTKIHGEQNQLPTKNSIAGKKSYWASSFNLGCYSNGIEAKVEIFSLPVVNAGDDISTTAGERGSLNATVDREVTANWSPTIGLKTPNSLTTNYVALDASTYTIEVIDQNNCVNTDELFLNVNARLIVSNVMTPNGDGDNDVWKMYPESTLSTCQVKLYDGFGRELLNTNSYLNDWDGNYKGEAVPDGDYYFHISCQDGFSEKGTLTILR